MKLKPRLCGAKKRPLLILLLFSFVLISCNVPKIKEINLENCKGQECVDFCKQNFEKCQAFCEEDIEKCPKEVLVIFVAEIKKVAKELEKSPLEKRHQTIEGFSNETLKTICQQEEWPPDCDIIPVAEGVEICKRCKSMLPENQKTWPGTFPSQGLGNICTGKECEKFCMENSEVCREYCSSHPENENCRKSSPLEQEQTACSDGGIMFEYPPANLDKITYIEPMGSLHGEHVAPIDHQYYKNFNNNEPTIEVYSPADGIIKEIQHMGSFKGDRDFEPFDDYRLTIEHTCSISTFFIHIDKLSDKIMETAPEFGKYKKANVPVKAGEVIGWYDNSVDFNVVDNAITINLIEPESYKYFPYRLHIQDPFNYFNEPLKRQLIAKSLRTAKPEGGFIDYDIDGKIIGTWFVEDTNGWSGLNQERYWADHLAIVYDSIDPEHILISIGTFKGKAQQFGVKSNAPRPDEVSIGTGLIKYELVDYRYYDGDNEWDFKSLVKGLKVKNGNYILGVALLQMLEDRKLKVEVFPEKTAAQVNGFTENAKIYVR